jgi:hypothetical protein
MRSGIIRTGIASFIALFVPAIGAAQEDEPVTAYVYATYFVCDPADESRADEIVKRNYAPHYDAAVEAGDIASWSWISHFVGGKWRRVLVLTTTNMDDLLDASGALGEILEETTPEAGRVFTEVCDVHEDYIWSNIPGIGSATPGIVRDVFAPIYDRRVASGDLVSWAWLQHDVGGDWRRLLTTTATDHKTMMRVRAEIIEELGEGRAERATRQFNEICPRHHDYMWDIQVETP